MSDDLSVIADNWAATLKYLETVLAAVNLPLPPATDGAPKDVQGIFKRLKTDDWGVNRKVYTFGRLPLDQAIPAAAAGLMPWWPVLTGRAYAGDLEGMRRVQDAIEKYVEDKEERPNPNAAMTWISYPHDLQDGYKNTIKADVLQQLFDWGANPNYDSGSWFEKTLGKCDADIIETWLDNGASLKTMTKVINYANGRNAELYHKLVAVLPGRAFYDKLDADTLLETKFVPDVGGISTLRTMFNFKARRVQEVYEAVNMQQPVMHSVTFNEYSVTAIEEAMRRMEKLTGKEVVLGAVMDKPRHAKLGVPKKP